MSSSLSLPHTPLFEALAGHPPTAPAIVHSVSGKSFTYGQLLNDIAAVKDQLLVSTGVNSQQDLEERRIAMLIENGYEYVGVSFSHKPF